MLKKDSKFVWSPEHEKCFEEIKKLFKSDLILKPFDSKRETVVETDSSSYGTGAILKQKYSDGYYPVQFASRTLNSAEKNYSQIERECLSVVFGCEKFKKFLLGGKFIIKNDHLPLRKLLSPDSPVPINCSARLQRWRLRLSQYNYTFEYIKGEENVNADFLSRLPLKETTDIEEPYELIFVMKSLDKLPINCKDIEKHTNNDCNLVLLKKYVLTGFPSKLDSCLLKYKTVINELSVMKGCLMYRDRVIVPESLRDDVLHMFHQDEAHAGISAMKMHARALVWFPGIDAAIENIVKSCITCQALQAKPPQKFTEWPTPDGKWHRVHIDHLFYENKTFLVLIDPKTKYIECMLVKTTSSEATIEALREIFSRNGLPHTVVSDNASCFKSQEYVNFMQQNGIHLMYSPVYMPSSNGAAERAVKVMKDLLKKNKTGSIRTRLSNALLYYRSTCHSVTKVAPCVALNNRKLITIKDRINPLFVPCIPAKVEKIRTFKVNDNVLILNVRQGPKWFLLRVYHRMWA